jgi:hypothetical protein
MATHDTGRGDPYMCFLWGTNIIKTKQAPWRLAQKTNYSDWATANGRRILV